MNTLEGRVGQEARIMPFNTFCRMRETAQRQVSRLYKDGFRDIKMGYDDGIFVVQGNRIEDADGGERLLSTRMYVVRYYGIQQVDSLRVVPNLPLDNSVHYGC